MLRGIDEELRREWPYPRIILPQLEVAGVRPIARRVYRYPSPAQDVPEQPMALMAHVHRLAEPANTSAGA
ncbi:MAG: hypothetical protein M3461_00580 [Pseudomonadota bacterium]|nr:hypothetical protein [Pseudomonadota bacterium]